MELALKKGSTDKLNEAASKIQQMYMNKIKKKREARELRQ